jgi:hypothetical protein
LSLSLPLGGVGLFSVGGGLLFVGGGGVDCVGQLAPVSITKPSGHVFVVGGVNGGQESPWLILGCYDCDYR